MWKGHLSDGNKIENMYINLWSSAKHIITFIYIIHFVSQAIAQLLINVQNQGGEVMQETITSNIADDIITLEFQKSDGTLITWSIIQNEVQILKALVLGEEERGQSQYQVVCFVTKFLKNDFISTDAMAKLRQKNPSTIRQPEEDRGRENYTMTAWIDLMRSPAISRHIPNLCAEASDATYVRDVDVKAWAETGSSGVPQEDWEAATRQFPLVKPPRCNNVSGVLAPCMCSFEICIGWFPCGLKFCKGKPENKNNGSGIDSYRCGIKTCRKCNRFTYYVRQKQLCLWDD